MNALKKVLAISFYLDFNVSKVPGNGATLMEKNGCLVSVVVVVKLELERVLFQAVGLIRREKTILVATMDNTIVSFSSKGKKLWQLKLPANILCLEPIDLPARGLQLAAVALSNKQVLLFNDKHVVDCFRYVQDLRKRSYGFLRLT